MIHYSPIQALLGLLLSICVSAVFGGCRAGTGTLENTRPAFSATARTDSANAAAYYYFSAAQMKRREGDLAEAQWYLEQVIRYDPHSAFPKLELAEIHMVHNQPDQALSLIQTLLADHPDHSDALIMMGRVYQQQGMLSSAKMAFEKALATGSFDPNLYLHLGGLYWDDNDPSNAERIFGLMTQRFPQSYAAHYFNGKALFAQDKLDQAEQAFKQSLALEPSLEEPRYELIKIYEIQGRIDALINTLQALLAHHPDNVSAMLDLAVYYRHRGQSELGLPLLFNLGQQSESNNTLLAYLFERYYENKEFEIAAWALEGMLAGAPHSSELHYLTGLAYDGLQNTQNALAHLAQVQAQSRFFGNAAVHRALLLHDTGRIDQAIQVIEQALALDPHHANYYLYLGAFHEELERYEQALDALKQAVALDDRNARYHFRMGVIYDKMGRRDDVIDAMRRALEIQPEDAETLNYLGYTYAELGIHLEEAEKLIQHALRIKPEDGYITDSLAWVYYKMGRYEEALAWMLKAVALVPDDPTILEHLGDVYLKLEKIDQALKYYRRSLELKDNERNTLEEKIRALKQSI